jgi:O-antigen ligase
MGQRALLFGQYAFVLLGVPLALLGRQTITLRRMLVGYAWGVALLTMAALAITVLDPVLALTSGALSGSGRLAAFVGNSNAYSRQAGIAALIFFWATDSKAWPRSAWLWRGANGVGLLVVGVGAVLAQSFGGLGALAGGLALVALLSRRLPTLAVGGGLFVVAAAGALLAASLRTDLPLSSRLVRDLSRGDLTSTGNFSERAHLKQAAWRQVVRSPVRGLGADRFRESTETGQGAHDTLLLIWAEGGIPAVTGFLLVLAMLGIVHLRALGAGDHDHSIALGIGIYVLFLLALVVNNHVYARGLTVPVLLAGVMSLLHGEGAWALRWVARPRALQEAVT